MDSLIVEVSTLMYDHHYITKGVVNLKFGTYDSHIADILTKPLGSTEFQLFKKQFMFS